MKDIVIIGAGGFAREVQWLINDINKVNKIWNIVGFIDNEESKKGLYLNEDKVIGDFDEIKNLGIKDLYYVCGVGDPKLKKKLSDYADGINLKPATLIHPSVIMSDLVSIGEGSIICASNTITVNITIGKHVILNLDCTVGHDAIIGDYSTVLPSVNISGSTNIGKLVSMGTGSFLIQGVSIGDNSIIGAGAVVVKDIPENSTAIGIPAKVIK